MRNFAVLCFVLMVFSGCIGQKYKISTNNMLPTLKVGNICNAEEIKESPIQRFDIVVFNMPEDVKKLIGEKGNAEIISRVVGMSGEKIEIKQGKTYVDGELLNENFEKTLDAEKDFPIITIPEGEYFLLGDNRPESLDSRHWKKTTVARKEISGKILRCS